jgi:hypothetical protein
MDCLCIPIQTGIGCLAIMGSVRALSVVEVAPSSDPVSDLETAAPCVQGDALVFQGSP